MEVKKKYQHPAFHLGKLSEGRVLFWLYETRCELQGQVEDQKGGGD